MCERYVHFYYAFDLLWARNDESVSINHVVVDVQNIVGYACTCTSVDTPNSVFRKQMSTGITLAPPGRSARNGYGGGSGRGVK